MMGGVKKEKLRGNVSEILPGVFRIVLPIPGSRPGPLNVYLFTGNPVTLVDTGFVKTTGVLAESSRRWDIRSRISKKSSSPTGTLTITAGPR